MATTGAAWCPLPRPLRIFELRPLKWLLEQGVLIICAGGGGIPTMYARGENRQLVGVEAVVDKDLAGSLLARDLEADLYVMATDVDGVYTDWGAPNQRRLDRATTTELEAGTFPAGSMGPKVEAAVEFVKATGRRAAIGSLDDIDAIVAGTAGTSIVPADA